MRLARFCSASNSNHNFVDRIDLFVVRIVRSRCRISLATFFCSGGGASRVGLEVAATVIVAAAVGEPDFGFSLGIEGRVLVALGGVISIVVGSSDISDRYRLCLVYVINRERKTIVSSPEIPSKMSPTGY